MNISSLRIITMLLAVVMLLSVLASCSGEKMPQSTDTDIQTQTETEAITAAFAEETTSEIVESAKPVEPTFVDADFGGQTFTILAGLLNHYEFSDNCIDNDELNGEPVNDAVIERNRAVEEKYNVDIVVRPAGVKEAKTAAKAGTVDFELIYDSGYYLPYELIAEGLTYDFLQIPHINLTQDYWAPSLQDDLTFAGKMLIATCDITMNHYSRASFVIFNKHLLDGYGIEYPYELVESGEWTVDKLIELIVQCSSDVNGDNIWSFDDIYGDNGGSAIGLALNSYGIYDKLTVENDDGSHTVNLYTQEFVDIYNKYFGMDFPEGSVCMIRWDEWIADRDISQFEDKFEAARVFSFGEGHLTFDNYPLAYHDELEQMEDRYGILPNPKFDADQEMYYHGIDAMAAMFAVVKQSDKELVGAVMEYMAYESNQRVFPAFYAQTLREDADERDKSMIDIIYNSIYINEWTLYTDVAVGVEHLMGPRQLLSEILSPGTFDLPSNHRCRIQLHLQLGRKQITQKTRHHTMTSFFACDPLRINFIFRIW